MSSMPSLAAVVGMHAVAHDLAINSTAGQLLGLGDG
jgi:hypothetical protein